MKWFVRLASSAAGYACLVAALAKLYNIQGDISGIARRGSGSACRSVYGGFVRWHKGKILLLLILKSIC